MKNKEQLIADFWDNYNNRIGLCFECCDSEKLLKDLENTLIKAIAQTREETIMEVEEEIKDFYTTHPQYRTKVNLLSRINKLKK